MLRSTSHVEAAPSDASTTNLHEPGKRLSGESKASAGFAESYPDAERTSLLSLPASASSFVLPGLLRNREKYHWQTRLTVILLNGLMLDSVNTVVMLSPPATENVCVAS